MVFGWFSKPYSFNSQESRVPPAYHWAWSPQDPLITDDFTEYESQRRREHEEQQEDQFARRMGGIGHHGYYDIEQTYNQQRRAIERARQHSLERARYFDRLEKELKYDYERERAAYLDSLRQEQNQEQQEQGKDTFRSVQYFSSSSLPYDVVAVSTDPNDPAKTKVQKIPRRRVSENENQPQEQEQEQEQQKNDTNSNQMHQQQISDEKKKELNDLANSALELQKAFDEHINSTFRKSISGFGDISGLTSDWNREPNEEVERTLDEVFNMPFRMIMDPVTRTYKDSLGGLLNKLENFDDNDIKNAKDNISQIIKSELERIENINNNNNNNKDSEKS